MTTFLLIRHGQSAANVDETFAGHRDVPLTELGVKQAKLTAKFVNENFAVDAVYASDLSRAFVTGQAVAEVMNLPIVAEKGMREINGGIWEGTYYPDLPLQYPTEFNVWLQDIGNACCPGGETVRQMQQRLVATLRRIADENEGKTVAVATHACAIRGIMSYCKERGVDGMKDIPWVSNASVTIIEVENGEFLLKKAGLDEHLRDLSTAFSKNV